MARVTGLRACSAQVESTPHEIVFPAKAGTQGGRAPCFSWIPAFAGRTKGRQYLKLFLSNLEFRPIYAIIPIAVRFPPGRLDVGHCVSGWWAPAPERDGGRSLAVTAAPQGRFPCMASFLKIRVPRKPANAA